MKFSAQFGDQGDTFTAGINLMRGLQGYYSVYYGSTAQPKVFRLLGWLEARSIFLRVFYDESSGLPDEVRGQYKAWVDSIPMKASHAEI